MPVIRFGRRTVVAETDLVAYIAAHRQPRPEHPEKDDDPVAAGSPVKETADASGDSAPG